MRIVTIVGARPQFIKAAPLSVELRREHEEFLVHTGQHYDDNMSAVFFRELDIPAPDLDLGVGSGSHAEQTAAMLCGIEHVLRKRNPDAVLVYGDTNSTLAGALAAAKLHIPIAHVEAGLRGFNREVPEEVNRVLADHLSTWLFAPSQTAVAHLANEGIRERVHNVGDIMTDSVRLFAPRAAKESTILERLHLTPKEYCLATVHRAANTDCRDNLSCILRAFEHLPRPVVLPLHPRTRAAMARHGIDITDGHGKPGESLARSQIMLTEPLGYLDMLQLQQHAAVILTDSGGMQKEAYYLRVPCVTLREETKWTEWQETIEAGWNRLLDSMTPESILAATVASCQELPPTHPVLYGAGDTAKKILQILSNARCNAALSSNETSPDELL